MNQYRDLAARHAPLFRACIVQACDSQNPAQFQAVESLTAHRPEPLPVRLDRLLGEPEHRAAEVIEMLWWGITEPELFHRLFHLSVDELWSAWGCPAAMAA